ncbi:MAG TPA: hypothetical protein VJ249_07170 [Candidatus Bathyarchaeia archaeon]|nr:hypothetical protein [Candidatus Bathyarchaeia archaeon]
MTQKSTLNRERRKGFTFEVLSRDLITRVLGTVANDRAFFFYLDVGKPTGDFAVSLSDFRGKINVVAPKSLIYHLKRGDFENWVREVIGDLELAERISKTKTLKATWKSDSTMRNRLHTVVGDRIAELQDLWCHAWTWPETVTA